jgi:hypothetical protein
MFSAADLVTTPLPVLAHVSPVFESKQVATGVGHCAMQVPPQFCVPGAHWQVPDWQVLPAPHT